MKTINEINKKIKEGKAIVLTATEAKLLAEEEGTKTLAEKVDVVTTATFSPMCSSGVFINPGHTSPHMKMQKVTLDGVEAYGGIATADIYLGVTQESREDSRFGGAHVIKKLLDGEKVEFQAFGKPTDCYPKTEFRKSITLEDLNQAYFYNPRNCYQNYNAAYNSSEKELRTYMGILQPNGQTIHYAGSGEISPLINDPLLETIGVGTKIFFCGGEGFISWEGTQFNMDVERDDKTNLPIGPSATLAITAEMRSVDPRLISPIYIPGYGVSIYLSIGMAIPVINSDVAKALTIRNRDIITNVHDYATGKTVSRVNYDELINNEVYVNGKRALTRTMSRINESYSVMETLKAKVLDGSFVITEPVRKLPVFGKCTPIE